MRNFGNPAVRTRYGHSFRRHFAFCLTPGRPCFRVKGSGSARKMCDDLSVVGLVLDLRPQCRKLPRCSFWAAEWLCGAMSFHGQRTAAQTDNTDEAARAVSVGSAVSENQ